MTCLPYVALLGENPETIAKMAKIVTSWKADIATVISLKVETKLEGKYRDGGVRVFQSCLHCPAYRQLQVSNGIRKLFIVHYHLRSSAMRTLLKVFRESKVPKFVENCEINIRYLGNFR